MFITLFLVAPLVASILPLPIFFLL